MEYITNLITNNMEIVVSIVGFLILHFSASILTAITKTKNTKFYKLVEVLALVVKEAKQKAKK